MPLPWEVSTPQALAGEFALWLHKCNSTRRVSYRINCTLNGWVQISTPLLAILLEQYSACLVKLQHRHSNTLYRCKCLKNECTLCDCGYTDHISCQYDSCNYIQVTNRPYHLILHFWTNHYNALQIAIEQFVILWQNFTTNVICKVWTILKSTKRRSTQDCTILRQILQISDNNISDNNTDNNISDNTTTTTINNFSTY